MTQNQLQFYHNDSSKKVTWITHDRYNLIEFTDNEYIIGNCDWNNGTLSEKYIAVDMNGITRVLVDMNMNSTNMNDPYLTRLRTSATSNDVIIMDCLMEPVKSDPYACFSNSNDFVEFFGTEARRNLASRWKYEYYHECKFDDYMLTRVANNYIISEIATGIIISIMHDPKTYYQEGDCATRYFYKNKNLFVWNDGDVYSVVHINICDTA